MDPFYALGLSDPCLQPPNPLTETRSAVYLENNTSRYDFPLILEQVNAFDLGNCMQLESAPPSPSNRCYPSIMEAEGSESTPASGPSKSAGDTTRSCVEIEGLPGRRADAKRARSYQTDTNWKLYEDTVSKDLKKIRLPTATKLSIFVKTLAGQQLSIEYVFLPFRSTYAPLSIS